MIDRKLDVPVVEISAKAATKQFSFLAPFIIADNPASSEITRAQLGWEPTQQGLIEDLEHGRYFEAAAAAVSAGAGRTQLFERAWNGWGAEGYSTRVY